MEENEFHGLAAVVSPFFSGYYYRIPIPPATGNQTHETRGQFRPPVSLQKMERYGKCDPVAVVVLPGFFNSSSRGISVAFFVHTSITMTASKKYRMVVPYHGTMVQGQIFSGRQRRMLTQDAHDRSRSQSQPVPSFVAFFGSLPHHPFLHATRGIVPHKLIKTLSIEINQQHIDCYRRHVDPQSTQQQKQQP